MEANNKIRERNEIPVEDEVVEEVSDINDSALEEIEDIEFEDTVEGGILSEALKTLAVGGMVRLTSKLLGKDVAETLLKGK